MKKVSLLTQILLSFSFTGCGQRLFDKQLELLYQNTVPLVQPAQLAADLNQKKQIILLDTRSLAEFEVSHLAQARLVNYTTFSVSQLKDIPLDVPIVVYCAVGVRSEKVGEKLLAAGYKNVHNLYGGIFKWKNQGLPVVNSANLPTDSVHTYNRYWAVWLTKGIKIYD